MDVSGILRDSLVLSHALPCQMIATAGHRFFDHVIANGIRQLQVRPTAQDCSCSAGSPIRYRWTRAPPGINLPVGISRWQPDPSPPERPKKADRLAAPKVTSSHLSRLQDALL